MKVSIQYGRRNREDGIAHREEWLLWRMPHARGLFVLAGRIYVPSDGVTP